MVLARIQFLANTLNGVLPMIMKTASTDLEISGTRHALSMAGVELDIGF